jgi:hypothetical protein
MRGTNDSDGDQGKLKIAPGNRTKNKRNTNLELLAMHSSFAQNAHPPLSIRDVLVIFDRLNQNSRADELRR